MYYKMYYVRCMEPVKPSPHRLLLPSMLYCLATAFMPILLQISLMLFSVFMYQKSDPSGNSILFAD